MVPCTLKQLPADLQLLAAESAVAVNPANAPAMSLAGIVLPPQHLAAMTQKYWGSEGVDLTLSFFEETPLDLQKKLLDYFNYWSKYCNARFRLSRDGDVRLTRSGDGYWSYLGTDIKHIARNQPTMCLSGFTMQTPESEWRRVVPHEVGHTMGFPHEHMRRDIIGRLNIQKTIDYFWRTQGWTASTVYQQVLTPIEEKALLATPRADETSIMAYMLPGSITNDGTPIVGGSDLSTTDKEFAAKLYPLKAAPPPPVTGGDGMGGIFGTFLLQMLKGLLEKWLADGTFQKILEELLKRFIAEKPRTTEELAVLFAQVQRDLRV